jgi:hypothetical protein
MKPSFSREAVVDRRQPAIRWSAVLGGAALALGLWNLFNLLFTGGALTSIDPDELDRSTGYGIGTGIGSVLAPVVAMFVGGMVAGRIAAHYDRRVSAAHGALVWALTSVVGLVLMASVVGNLVDKRGMAAHADMAMPPPGTSALVDDQLRLVNQHLKSQNAHTIAKADFLDAARYATGDNRVNRDGFISRLDANTDLSRPEAESALDRLGASAPETLIAAGQLAIHREQSMKAAETTGNVMLGAGVGLFLCLLTSIAGAIIGARNLGHRAPIRHDTIPGQPIANVTSPYPAPPPPAE